MRKIMLTLIMAFLSLLAFASVASACHWFWYQPEVPASLRK
jgi:cyclic lactone autoinducer peptide